MNEDRRLIRASDLPLTDAEQVEYLCVESNELKRTPPKLPDWNQEDPTAPDYIKNRTHYAEVMDGEITLTINPGDVVGAAVASQIYEQRKTAKYTVAGSEYEYLYWFDAGDGTEDWLLYNGVKAIRATNRFDNTIQFYTTTDTSTPTALDGERVTVDVTFNGKVEIVHKLDPKYLPPEVAGRKPLLLDATLSDYYGGNAEAGDEALEAIKTGRQILVKVPNASGDNYVASYSPVYFSQVPLNGQYLYLFFLRDEKQDLSALLGQPEGTVLMPTYGQFQMLLSKKYESNPLES